MRNKRYEHENRACQKSADSNGDIPDFAVLLGHHALTRPLGMQIALWLLSLQWHRSSCKQFSLNDGR
jgi:hypothetical protein